MKFVLFRDAAEFRDVAGKKAAPGILTDRGVVDVSSLIPATIEPQAMMQAVIDSFQSLKRDYEKLSASGPATPLERVKLLPPLPRPGKILCCIGNYWEHAQREARPLNMFMKSPDAVIGPDDTIQLPDHTEPWIFMHEAELAIVFKGPVKGVTAANWRDAVFGYTGLIDVSARGEGRYTWKQGSWIGKSFDTFAPIGPCITTADEIPDPNDVHIRFWNDGQLRHDYSTNDMEHRVPELIEFASKIMTLNSGDVLACGTNHEGLGALQDGERVEIDVAGVARMSLNVVDPLKRTWERGVYMGKDSTNHEAIRAHAETGKP